MAPILVPLFGVFFRGAYLPQKRDLAPHLDREGIPFQKYVPSYITKFSPIWFVSPVRKALTSGHTK
jgi:hypothetical protein